MPGTQIDVKQANPLRKPPADMWGSLGTEMDRLFDRFSGGFSMAPFSRMFGTELAPRYESSFSFTVPAVDVAENGTSYKITAELPGLTEKDIEVKMEEEILTLKGEKRQDREEKDENYHLCERAYGRFERSFRLPAGVERDEITAEFTKGVLTITVPKSAAALQQAKTIPIKSAA